MYMYRYSTSVLFFLSLADDINCFDTGECFALAFGVPAFLMILSIGRWSVDTAG